jgi:hypothetical protein
MFLAGLSRFLQKFNQAICGSGLRTGLLGGRPFAHEKAADCWRNQQGLLFA